MPNEYPYGAMQTTYEDGEYTQAEVTQFRFPLRVRLQEDRISDVEKKFFCGHHVFHSLFKGGKNL